MCVVCAYSSSYPGGARGIEDSRLAADAYTSQGQAAYQPPTYQMDKLAEAPLEFAQDSKKFLSRTTKPNRKEYLQIVRAVGAGFLMMGAIGYVVKLVHIPIRHLITV